MQLRQGSHGPNFQLEPELWAKVEVEKMLNPAHPLASPRLCIKWALVMCFLIILMFVYRAAADGPPHISTLYAAAEGVPHPMVHPLEVHFKRNYST